MDRGLLREFEFVRVLADLMRASERYSDVVLDADLSQSAGVLLRPDIFARSYDGIHKVLVECKGVLTVTQDRLQDALAQLKVYQSAIQADDVVLALPARLTPAQKETVRLAGVLAWDLDEIAARFHGQLQSVDHPVLRPLLLAAAALKAPSAPSTPEAGLLAELKSLPAGRANWVPYQKLISRIFERLFCPPLSTPIVERLDETRVNRRDMILPNYADRGFWAFVRARYQADFLVVDAKNHVEPVGKAEALQVLNYLKAHGAGLLGMIVCRRGYDWSCAATLREQWALEGKMLVVLSDEHVERMLRIKEAGGPPEDVIRQWIEDFRLSL